MDQKRIKNQGEFKILNYDQIIYNPKLEKDLDQIAKSINTNNIPIKEYLNTYVVMCNFLNLLYYHSKISDFQTFRELLNKKRK